MEQLATNERAVLSGKLVHELPCLQVGRFHSGSIIFTPPPMPQSQDENATCNGTTHFLLARHPRTKTTRDLQGDLLCNVAFFPESVKD
jgi:hypothetical protein